MEHTGMRGKKWLSAVMLVLAVLCAPQRLWAAEATVTFGSEYYEATDNEQFQVGVYISADGTIGTYHVEVFYDNRRLLYLGGGDAEEDGVITLTGEGRRSQVKYMLSFRTLSGGTAEIGIRSASVGTGEEGEELVVPELITTAVYIAGEDTVGEPEETEEETEEDSLPVIVTDVPLCGETSIGDEVYYIVDLDAYLPEGLDWNYQLVSGRFGEERVTWASNLDMSVLFLYLMDGSGQMHLYAYSQEKERLYPCNALSANGTKYYYMSPYVQSDWPQELTLDIIREASIVYVMDLSGQCGFYRIGSGNELIPWGEVDSTHVSDRQTMLLVSILGVTVLVIAVTVGITVALDHGSRRQEQRDSAAPEELQELLLEDFSLDVTPEEILAWRDEALETAEKGPPVIAVRDVSMMFRVATSNVSGIKEYVISRIKGELSYRELWALKHISFNVYRGEVVGIIGTNGSGKSTLLKIVSGALKPTAGRVDVDWRKVQLLTLGTGFDMELTARENVYLNGALIGYSREFIDERYEEIVSFAELEGFMEERVKNFSSGMVSRLGFAIATVGDAADILILDEVLSVGDQFFREKSLQRIKEIIHGGSTVLMVSHGIATILEHCTKAVWIEKGELRMAGDPKEVCAAYQGMRKG